MVVRTVFRVPRLNSNSVAAAGCCPVPAEALIVPELEAVVGVHRVSADWRRAEVAIDHAPRVQPADLAEVLAELSYPAADWATCRNTVASDGVTSCD
ncbi:MAG: hypothetical protein M3336_09000 [Chloroflexota bacterium]|nr:hypothetical protein [Chloroflexota bacterium]